ncbi:MAG: signal peptide peptidase SppA [Rhodospirillales bacterium]|nr:signal peptide peptidase SppA [Rhodospirillales bacterium]
MSLDADSVVDRRQLKKRLRLWQIFAIIAIAVSVALFFGRGTFTPQLGDYIAKFEVSGVIVDDPKRDKLLADIAKDEKVKAVIVRINSPGGTVVGGENLYTSLREITEKKPVVAVMGELATSAGYMTAIAADHIVARQGTITGSIGVILQTTEFTGLFEKIGIKPESIKSRPLKAQPSPLEVLSDEGRAATKAVVMDMYHMFVEMVSKRRNMPLDKTIELADGRIYTGRQALKNGLVDAIGGQETAITWLKEKREIDTKIPVKDVRLKDDLPIIQDIISGITGKSLFSERLTLDGLLSLWHPAN